MESILQLSFVISLWYVGLGLTIGMTFLSLSIYFKK